MALNPTMGTAWKVKLERADELIDDLADEIAAYLRNDSIDVVATPSATLRSAWDLRLQLGVSPPTRWSAVIGDVLHNERSALDAYAYDVITSSATTFTEKQLRRLAFPLSADQDAFDSYGWCAGLKPPDEIRDAFRYAQPWYPLSEAGLDGFDNPAGFVEATGLRRLSRLNNDDKHKMIHVTVCNPSMMWSALPEGAAVTSWTHDATWPWVDGATIATVTVDGLVGDATPSFGHTFDVALVADAAPLQAHSLISRLREFRAAAAEAITHVQWVLGNN